MNDAEKDPARIADMFDAIAGRYDLLNHLLSFRLDSRWRADAIRAADLRPGDTVVDLCAGTCDLAIAAVSRSARLQLPARFGDGVSAAWCDHGVPSERVVSPRGLPSG